MRGPSRTGVRLVHVDQSKRSPISGARDREDRWEVPGGQHDAGIVPFEWKPPSKELWKDPLDGRHEVSD